MDDYSLVTKANRGSGRIWLWAILMPIILFTIFMLIAALAPRTESDWYHLAAVLPLLGAKYVSIVAWFALTVLSFLSREKRAYIAIIGGILLYFGLRAIWAMLAGTVVN